MKQYLKMDDVFVYDSVEELEQYVYAGYMSKHCSEYAAHAINSHDELVQMSQELLAALEGLLDIVGDSYGVFGYRPNCDIAEWCEFEELNAAYDAANKANGGAAK